MKVKEYLRDPDVKWVDRAPRRRDEDCLVTAIVTCYPDSYPSIIGRVTLRLGIKVSSWNDQQANVNAILRIVDELDI